MGQAKDVGQVRYVWLDINTGEFTDSWDESFHKIVFKDDEETKKHIEKHSKHNLKLIKYHCVNDNTFELYSKMKIVTNTKKK